MNIKLSEKEIDDIVVAQADDDDAWEEPVEVTASPSSTIELPYELAARAAFFARLHKQDSLEEWITMILRERIAFEESAFAELKHSMMEKEQVAS